MIRKPDYAWAVVGLLAGILVLSLFLLGPPTIGCAEDENLVAVDHRTPGAVEYDGVSRLCVHFEGAL